MIEPARDELKTHHCLESIDVVADDPETTAFKRCARFHQAMWREKNHLSIGSHPMRPEAGQSSRPLGSRIAVDHAQKSGANFLSEEARRAARHRLENPEPHQLLNEDRLFADLLSSMPMCFNLFGPLHDNIAIADIAVKKWWPDAPGDVRLVRFEWSPGRCLSGEYLENRSAFDVAFELEMPDGSSGAIGVETKYHEDCRAERIPSDDRIRRYSHVTEASGIFRQGAATEIIGTDLQQIWLDHLLALSMTQRRPKLWSWTKFVLIHPERNPSYAKAAARYRALLEDESSFEVRTIESLLDAGVLPVEYAAAFRDRYLW